MRQPMKYLTFQQDVIPSKFIFMYDSDDKSNDDFFGNKVCKDTNNDNKRNHDGN